MAVAKNNELKKVENRELGMQSKQWDIIGKETPQKYVMKRQGRGGKTLSYVETGYIIELLNTTFNGMWDFEITEQTVGQEQVWVKGRLTTYIATPDGIKPIVKTQYGGAAIKKTGGVTIDIADDLKAASSDALKKCASMFGFASDIYWRGEHVNTTDELNKDSDITDDFGKPTEPTNTQSTSGKPEFIPCVEHRVNFILRTNKVTGSQFYSHSLPGGGWHNYEE